MKSNYKEGSQKTIRQLFGRVTIAIGEEEIGYDVPIVFKRNDPVDGEVYEPVAIGPPVMANLSDKVLIFDDGTSKRVDVKVIAGRKNVKGKIEFAST